MALPQKTSLHGRRFGLGFNVDELLTNGNRIDVATINSPSTSSGATLPSNGVAIINSTAVAANMLIPAPTEGAKLEIAIIGNSSLLTLNAAAAGFTIGTSSTALVFTGAAAGGLKNISALLRGLSSTAWALMGVTSTAVVTLG